MWIKENWIFLGIVIFTIGIRLYYFFLTLGQPLWYDESVYMLISQKFAFGVDYSFPAVRPILFSLITAMFLIIKNNELLPRLFMLVLSMFSVWGMYLLGKEVVNKNVGLISSFLMSIFYLNLFFTYRLLVDLPSLTFFIFSALFFYKYCKTKSGKFLYLASFVVAVGTLFKLSTAFILIPFFIYILTTERMGFLKKKETWIALTIFLMTLLPYIIWGYSEFGGFVFTQASSHVAPESYLSGLGILKNYLMLFPTYLSWIILYVFILGLIFMYKIVIYFDKVIKGGNDKLRRDFYLFLIFIIPLVLISIFINHNEDRYIFIVFPSIMIISSSFIWKIYEFIKKNNKVIAIILLVLLLIFPTYYQLNSADKLIKNKQDSYLDVKQAGLWLRENSNDSDIIATRSQPQIRYYSGLDTIGISPTEEEFEQSLTNETKFFMISIFESHPEWAYSYPERKNLTLARVHVNQDNQPILVIYNLK